MKLPRYWLVGDRPVKAVATPEGGMDLLAWEWKTGAFVREMGYLTRVMTGMDPEVDEVDAAAFEAQCQRLRGRLRPS